MKKLLFILLISAGFVACNNDANDNQPIVDSFETADSIHIDTLENVDTTEAVGDEL